MGDSLGAVSVDIVGDFSKLSAGINGATAEASKGGNAIASAFTSATVKTQQLQLNVDTLRAKYQDLASDIERSGAGTSQQYAAMETLSRRVEIAQQKLALSFKETGHAAEVSGQQATSAFIRVAEGSGGLRAVENFLAKTVGIGPALQAIFPVVGAIAFGEIIGRIGEKLYEFYQNAQQAPERANAEFLKLNSTIDGTIIELTVANDKLHDQLAVLTGGHENTVKTLLDEAASSAHKFTGELQQAIDKLNEFIQKTAIGKLQGFISGQASTDDFSKDLDKLGQNLSIVNQRYEQDIAAAHKLGDAEKSLSAESEARNRKRIDSEALINLAMIERTTALGKANDLEAQAARNAALVASGEVSARESGGLNTNVGAQSGKIEQIKVELQELDKLKTAVDLGTDSIGTSIAAGLAKANNKGASVADSRARAQIQEWTKEEEQLKAHNQLNLRQDEEYWNQKLAIVKAGLGAFAGLPQIKRPGVETQADFVREIDTKTANTGKEADRKSEADAVKYESQQWQLLEESIKEAQAQAEKTGGGAAQVKLQILSQELISDAQAFPELFDHIFRAIPEAQIAADKESLTELHGFLAETESAYKESFSKQGKVAQPEDIKARLEGIIRAYAEIPSVVAAARKEMAALDKQIVERNAKVTGLQDTNTTAAGEADIASKKLAVQSAYDLEVNHGLQDQLQLQSTLAALDAENLKLKLAHADAEVAAAKALGDQVKIQEALNVQAAAQRAIDAQSRQSAAALRATQRQGDVGFQISSGLSQNVNSFGQSLANSFGNAIANGQSISKAFQGALKQLEGGSISTVVGSIVKNVLSTGPLHSAITTLTTSIGSLIGAVVTNTGALFSHLGVMTAHLAVMIWHGAIVTAQTIATIAQTVATWALEAVELIKGGVQSILGLFGFAAGGRPPVGVPSLVGESGAELFIPDAAGTIIPADKTKAFLSGISAPSVPSSAFFSGADGSSNSHGSAAYVTNHNVGSVGDMHFHLYGDDKPRQVARSLAQYLKQTFPTGSPLNAKG
jgi:hypothetical protein